MSGNGQGPNSGEVVGNGPRMVARGCQGSPEVPVDLKPGLQTAPGPGGAANGQIRRNRGSPPAAAHQQWGRRHGAATKFGNLAGNIGCEPSVNASSLP